MNVSEDYLKDLIKPRSAIFMEMEQYAKENHVPIMQLMGMESLYIYFPYKNQNPF